MLNLWGGAYGIPTPFTEGCCLSRDGRPEHRPANNGRIKQLSDKDQVSIKMRGELGEVEMIIPHTYFAYYVTKDSETKLMSTVNVAIAAYKAMGND